MGRKSEWLGVWEVGVPGGAVGRYSAAMNIVSLPDPLCVKVEQLAKALGVARGRLYAEAIAEYLAPHSGAATTAKLNEVYAEQKSALADELARAQSNSLSDGGW
jgi:predicted transcriptional regulator